MSVEKSAPPDKLGVLGQHILLRLDSGTQCH